MATGKWYGIDLGTTNSLIGLWEEEGFQLFQNRDRMNATPSAVYLRNAEQKCVGQKALDLMKDDPDNGKAEFKRNMGRSDTFHCPRADVELTATELAAEVLKSILNDVRRLRGQTVDSAVITVPSAFGVAPCRATVDAAHLAGIKNVILLQEPVAAAIAYGVQPGLEDEKWLVFDLGGGTFDVAIVSTRDRNLTVISHTGDRYLGGKDVERKMVKEVILPELGKKYSLPSQGTDAYKSLFDKLLRKAEDAKIALTYDESYLLDLFDLGEDLDGQAIHMEMQINQRDVEDCAREMLSRCIDLCRQAIEEARTTPGNIHRVLLVGGATQMPYVRKTVKEALQIEVDYSRDPITAIVEGAALFAFTQQGVASAPMENQTDFVRIVTDVDVTPGDDTAIVSGRVDGATPLMKVALVSKTDEWSTGWIDLDEQGFFTAEVMLNPFQKVQTFYIKLRSQGGQEIELENNQVNINRTIAVGAPKLQHSLWIELQDNGGSRFDLLLGKGSSLPSEEIERQYRIARNLTSGMAEEFLPIKVWEGEGKERDQLELVGVIRIERGPEILIQGELVELLIQVDESRIIRARVFAPRTQLMLATSIALPDDMGIHQRKRFLDDKLSGHFRTIDRLRHLIVPDTRIGRDFAKVVQEVEKLSIESYHNQDNPEEIDRLSQRERELCCSLKQISAAVVSEEQEQTSPYEPDKRKALAQLHKVKGKTGDQQIEQEISRLENEISAEDVSKKELGMKLRHAEDIYYQVVMR
ncbi:MAG: Hsp70 family protein, partial [Firmicutes bacterium]|nr:Hsp70 family protein [Bacillota bacterium]